MSLPHAILALLEEEPMTGYDLKTQGFDNHVNHFWSADQAQIYRTLDKLTEQGLVKSEIEYQEDRPNRKVYSITEAGCAELRQWLTTFQPLPVIREPFLIQLFFGAQLSNAELIALLQQQLQAYQERLERFEEVKRLNFTEDEQDSRAAALHRLTLERGFTQANTAINWVKHAIEVVQNLKE